MRIRRVLFCFALSLGVVVALPTTAGAAGGPEERTECAGEVIEKFEDGDVSAEDANVQLEDCGFEAPNPVLPKLNEVIWGGLSFLLVLVVLLKFGFPALKKGLAARQEKIREDLESAERARTGAESELEEYRRHLAQARDEAGRIIEEARQAADGLRRDLVAKAEADAAELRQRAADDIRLASERAMSDLQTRVGDLSIELAEKIVERNLDRDTQVALIESYINEVGSQG